MTTLLAPLPVQAFKDSNGNPLSGGQLYTYVAGTSTLITTYTDVTAATPNTNPIILNSRGECNLWLSSGQFYKLVLQDSYSVLIWSVDQISGGGAASGANSDITSLSGLTTPLTVAQGGTNAITPDAARDSLVIGSGSFRNRLVNGGFEVWQKSTGVVNPSGYAAVDQWSFSVGAININQIAAGSGDNATYRLRLSSTSATNGCDMVQPIESIQVNKFLGKTVSFSIDLVASIAATVNIVIDKSATANQASTSYTAINAKTCAVTATKTRFFVTAFIPDDGTALGVRCRLNFNNIPNGCALDALNAQLEVSGIATPFESVDPNITLIQCYRFYQNIPVAIYGGYNAAAGVIQFTQMLLAPMRSSPSFAITSATYANASGSVVNSTTTQAAFLSLTITAAGYGYAQISTTFSAQMT